MCTLTSVPAILPMVYDQRIAAPPPSGGSSREPPKDIPGGGPPRGSADDPERERGTGAERHHWRCGVHGDVVGQQVVRRMPLRPGRERAPEDELRLDRRQGEATDVQHDRLVERRLAGEQLG